MLLIMQKIKYLLSQDQENIKLFRNGNISLEEFKNKAEDLSNRFFEIYKVDGFPHKNKVSEDVYKGAVVLTLHQPTENLEEILNDIKDLSPAEVDPRDLAYMVDKIRVHKGENQVYGTQYKTDGNKITFLPIEDEENVDQRRKEVGMETLAKYKKKAEESL